MPQTIILNASNSVTVGNDKSTFKYQFPSSVFFEKGSQVAISAVSIYYSWYSISAQQGNNTFNYLWPDAFNVMQTYPITLPNGSYSVAEINAYLQSVMISYGHYLVDNLGNSVFYLQISENSTAYAVQIDAINIPTALPGGWSNPGALVFPAVSESPQFQVLANGFRDIIGFTTGLYPPAPSATPYSVLSSSVPQVSPVSTVTIRCNLVNSPFSNPSDIIFSFSPTASFGSILTPAIQNLIFNEISSGYYAELVIQFCDQQFNSLLLNDTNLLVTVVIRSPDER